MHADNPFQCVSGKKFFPWEDVNSKYMNFDLSKQTESNAYMYMHAWMNREFDLEKNQF